MACRRMGSGSLAPPFVTSALDEAEWAGSRPGRSTPRVVPQVPIGLEAGWAPEPVWTEQEKHFLPLS
jgi:hypothetical protein